MAVQVKLNDFDVIIEISANSAFPIKYEFDKDAQMLRVDRIMGTTMRYPMNYGFIPNTLGGDGDPIDVLLHSAYPLLEGSIIKCRAIGVLLTEDEGGNDAKIIAVPAAKIDPECAHIVDYTQLSEHLRNKLVHFFTHYKDLEIGKWVKILGWESAEKAAKIIADAQV